MQLGIQTNKLVDNRKTFSATFRGSFFFKLGGAMQDKKKLFKEIQKAKAVFDEVLLNKEYKYIYKDIITGKIKSFEMKCMANNFLHLTGVKTRLTGSTFYSALDKKKLSFRDIDYKKNGTTKLKLDMFRRLKLLFTSAVQVSLHDDFFTLRLEVDILVHRSKREFKDIILGLKRDKSGEHFVPASLLKQKPNKVGTNFSPVLQILQKDRNEKEYSRIVYQSKSYKGA